MTRLAASVVELVRSLERYRNDRASSLGVTPTAVRALARISESGGITPKDLAAKLALTTGSVTPLLDMLETGGMIDRVANPSDRRSQIVRLTARGRDAMSEAYADLLAHVTHAAETVPQVSASDLADYLDALIASVAGTQEPTP